MKVEKQTEPRIRQEEIIRKIRWIVRNKEVRVKQTDNQIERKRESVLEKERIGWIYKVNKLNLFGLSSKIITDNNSFSDFHVLYCKVMRILRKYTHTPF